MRFWPQSPRVPGGVRRLVNRPLTKGGFLAAVAAISGGVRRALDGLGKKKGRKRRESLRFLGA